MRAPNTRRLLAAMRRLSSSGAARVALTLVLTLAAALQASFARPEAATASTAIILNVLAVLPLTIAPRWPFSAAAVATVVTAVILVAPGAPLTVAAFGVLLFLLAQLVIRRGLLLAAPLLIPFMVLATPRFDAGRSGFASTGPLLFATAALVVGEAMRQRGRAVAALNTTEQAMAESTRARTVMEERTRIARELHDIVAHHLSVITVESEAARLTSPELSPDAAGRFEAIASTAREALAETRRLLGVLRTDAGGEADRTPQPGLGELDALIDTAQSTGTQIRLITKGDIDRLPPNVSLAAYRILQEALTNARRHAGGANVDVELAHRDDGLHLRIRDDGPGTLDGGTVAGHGLTGMRERATLAGGTFSAGPIEGGGFEVEAILPTEAAM